MFEYFFQTVHLFAAIDTNLAVVACQYTDKYSFELCSGQS